LFGVGELWTSGVKFRSREYSQTIADFEHPPSRHRFFELGHTYGEWQVLHPDPAVAGSRADDNALVLLGNFSGTKILLLSDLSRDGQSALLSRTNDLRADIVIAGLPEKGEPLCDTLLTAIHPRVIIIADSEKPVNRRANSALKQRLEQSGFPVIYTRTAGAVTIVTLRDGWMVQTMDGQRFSGTDLTKR
jgi:beta-lactamase superfamily II metal-dependent hydrolase